MTLLISCRASSVLNVLISYFLRIRILCKMDSITKMKMILEFELIEVFSGSDGWMAIFSSVNCNYDNSYKYWLLIWRDCNETQVIHC